MGTHVRVVAGAVVKILNDYTQSSEFDEIIFTVFIKDIPKRN